jgi:hypothetical protein
MVIPPSGEPSLDPPPSLTPSTGRKHAAAFHKESEITAIDLDEVFRIHDAAMVISQSQESQTPAYRWFTSRMTPPGDLLLKRT